MRMLFWLLFLGSNASAQSLFFPVDSAVVSTVDLPSRQPFDSAKSYNKIKDASIYIISINDMYRLFDYDTYVSYYQFNFADFHILGELKCMQCLAVCHHEAGQKNCHRNACDREWVWVKRDNKKAFIELPSSTMPGHNGRNDLPRYNDTVITTKPDTARWYTTGHGDCFAHFRYAVLADKYHPALILKEWNYWGGCRAGGSKESTISFKEPAGILYKVKRTILVERTIDKW